MFRTTRKRLTLGVLGSALGVLLFAGQAPAQTTGDRPGTDSGTTPVTPATGDQTGSHIAPAPAPQPVREDDGFDMGWLGLLGLAGLAGLLPKKTHTVTTHRTGDTTHRTGDAGGR